MNKKSKTIIWIIVAVVLVGLVAYDSDQPVFMGMEYGNQSRGGYSQETAAAIDAEIRRLITEAHERATKLLKEHRSIMDNMSRVLVEKETIYTEEVNMLMKGASYKEVIEFMEEREGTHQADPFGEKTPYYEAYLKECGRIIGNDFSPDYRDLPLD